MPLRSRFMLAGALIAAPAMLFAACGGDDDDSTPTNTVPAASPSAPATRTESTTPASTSTKPAATATTPAGNASPTANPTSAATATVPGTRDPSVCASDNLEVTLVATGAAAGTHFETINLKNTGSQPCIINGFPGVSLVDANGMQLGPAADRNTAIAATSISLATGESAHAVVGIPSYQNFPDGKCGAESTDMKIFPPGEYQAIIVPFADHACPGFSVQVFVPGVGEGH